MDAQQLQILVISNMVVVAQHLKDQLFQSASPAFKGDLSRVKFEAILLPFTLLWVKSTYC